MRRTFSIRYKFLAASTFLLLFCVATYLAMATTVFRRDKSQFVFEFNRTLVSNVASDIETLFEAVADKMRLVAYFFNARDEKSLEIVSELLAASPEIVFVGGSPQFREVTRNFFVQTPFVETYQLPDDFFVKILPTSKPIPFHRLQMEGEAVWNATIANGPPLIGFAKSVVIEDSHGKPISHYAVIAYLKADRILKSLTRSETNPVFIVNGSGEVIAHPENQRQVSGQDESLRGLVQEALANEIKTSVVPFKIDGADYLGAFSKAKNRRLMVLSRVSLASAFHVVDRFVFRSLLFAMIVGTLAFIVAIFFSRSITRPLEVLTGGMQKVAEGELGTQIQIKSGDEIAILAESFNGMIRDLKKSREELEEINRELESKVKDRTLQLEKQNQAVKSAQEALLRTTRLAAVGEIAGRAAHEVLNPLTSIMGRLEKLQARLSGERGSELQLLCDLKESWQTDFSHGGFSELVKNWSSPSKVLPQSNLWEEDLKNLEQLQKNLQLEFSTVLSDTEFLLKESHRINRIIQSMRTLSVVKADKKALNLAVLLEESVNIMRDLASQYGISIGVSCSDEALVAVDADEFVQATTNLIRNSIQAIQARRLDESNGFEGQISIKVLEEPESWIIEIADNGVGISEEHKVRLFEAQFSTKSRAEGTGLGLNISRRFMRAVGGDIILKESRVKEGSIFVIQLAKAKGSEAAA